MKTARNTLLVCILVSKRPDAFQTSKFNIPPYSPAIPDNDMMKIKQVGKHDAQFTTGDSDTI
jgi:hypothetical protein